MNNKINCPLLTTLIFAAVPGTLDAILQTSGVSCDTVEGTEVLRAQGHVASQDWS